MDGEKEKMQEVQEVDDEEMHEWQNLQDDLYIRMYEQCI